MDMDGYNMEKKSDDELIAIINEMFDYEDVQSAMLILSDRLPDIALELTKEIIIQNRGDTYLQACVWDFFADTCLKELISALSMRKDVLEWDLLRSVLFYLYKYPEHEVNSQIIDTVRRSFQLLDTEKKELLSELFDTFTKRSF